MSDQEAADPGGASRSEPGVRVLVSNRQSGAIDEADLVAVAERTLGSEGVSEGELSISFVTPDEMAELHVRYMAEDGPTDVLSFPMGEDGLLGDVVVCPQEAERNSADLRAELRLLVAHGVLHLLGYDHQEEDERAAMWAKQERYSGAPPPPRGPGARATTS